MELKGKEIRPGAREGGVVETGQGFFQNKWPHLVTARF